MCMLHITLSIFSCFKMKNLPTQYILVPFVFISNLDTFIFIVSSGWLTALLVFISFIPSVLLFCLLLPYPFHWNLDST